MTSTKFEKTEVRQFLDPEMISEMRNLVQQTFVDEKIFHYIGEIIFATRDPSTFGLTSLSNQLSLEHLLGATINFVKAARSKAFLSGRTYVTPEDIKYLSYDILRHRLLLSYEADAQEVGAEEVISEIIGKIKVP